jgi:SAM-dependent methyltransferase
MQHVEDWRPTKVLPAGPNAWRVNPSYVGPSSWFFCDRVIGAYVEAMRGHARGRLVDAGCGDVPYYGVYRDLVDAVTCIDWPGSSHGRSHIDQFVDLNGRLPFDDGDFDTVLLTDVLEHIAQPRALLGEVARVLAPGGKAIVTVPFLYWVHEAPHDYFRYTEHGLRALCDEAALQVVELSPYGGYPDVLLDLVSKGLVRGPRMGRAYHGLFRRVAAAKAYRRLAKRTAGTFPLGYVLVANVT